MLCSQLSPLYPIFLQNNVLGTLPVCLFDKILNLGGSAMMVWCDDSYCLVN
uniref:Uncharacterized protein n=1 Tax=Arundo donax TaxID=35708 RepID=A0A0A9EPG7_ARUDO